jgi:hypothetical protein
MSITKEMSDLLKEQEQKFVNCPKFNELQQFYLEMKQKGLICKQEYSLSRLDTIGWSIHHKTITAQKHR